MAINTTFSGFYTAQLGVYASQKALDVSGHNITNVNTNGYTRQRLDQISLVTGSYNRYASHFRANVGSGALTVSVSQIRDPYLDIRFRNEQANVGSYDSKLSVLEEITAILDEVAKDDGDGVLEKQLNELMTRLETLSVKTNQLEFDTQVRYTAQSLASLLNSYANRLEGVAENQSKILSAEVRDANTIMEQIAHLNSNIFSAEVRGDNALELRDQRNLLIDELSGMMKISVSYEPVGVGAGNTVDKLLIHMNNGGTTTAGSLLIDGEYFTQMSIDNSADNYDIVLSQLEDKLGNVKTGSTSVALADTDLFGSIQSLREMLTECGEYTDNSVMAYDPDSIKKRGIPFYQKSLDALAQKLAATFNEANTGHLINEDGNYLDANGDIILVGGNPVPSTDPAPPGAVAMGGALFSNHSSGDDTTGITAKNIAVSNSWATGDVRIVSSFIAGPLGVVDSSDNRNLAHMLVIFDNDYEYVANDVVADAVNGNTPYFKGSFQEMLANMCGLVASDTKTTTSLLTTYIAAATDINSSRDSVSSVDLNDEATNLMKYQKSYNAACRLMTTVDEAIDRLINNMGMVGR